MIERHFFKSHVEYNELVKKIEKDEGWFDEYIGYCQKYYKTNPCGGSLHIILDDGNIADCNVNWSAGYSCGAKDIAAKELAELMLFMTEEQRKKVVDSYDIYSGN